MKKKQVEAFIDEVGPEMVPTYLGGSLEIGDRWEKQLTSWEKKARSIKSHEHARQDSNIYWLDPSV